MQSRISFWLGILVGIAIAALILVIGIGLWQFIAVSALPAYTSSVAQPTSHPADLPELTSRVEKMENELAFTLRDIAWKMDQKLVVLGWTALLISFVAGFVGIKTYGDLDKVIKERVNQTLEQSLYQLDPTNLPIRLVVNEDMPIETERIWKRLGLTGLQNIEKISHLDKQCKKGVTILLIKEKDQEKKFFNWLIAHRILENGKETKERYLDAQKSAFVVYTPPSKWLEDNTLGVYDNLATANMPATVASMVLVVGRGLKNKEE